MHHHTVRVTSHHALSQVLASHVFSQSFSNLSLSLYIDMFVVALTAKLFTGLTICQSRANGTTPKQISLLEIQQTEQEKQLGCSSGGRPYPWQQLNFPVFST